MIEFALSRLDEIDGGPNARAFRVPIGPDEVALVTISKLGALADSGPYCPGHGPVNLPSKPSNPETGRAIAGLFTQAARPFYRG